MGDTSVTKVDSAHAPRGPEGERYLASGVRCAMRLWDEEAGFTSAERARDYEVVGYVLEGRAELRLEGQTVILAPGDSYVVPRGAQHHYRIIEHFRAVEATSPPAQVHGRDLVVDAADGGPRTPLTPNEKLSRGGGLGRHLRAIRRHQSRANATYHRLVDHIRSATNLASKGAAETALLVVLEGICRRIPQTEADHLLAQLSTIVRAELKPLPEKPDREITPEMIEAELRDQLHLSDEAAASVLSAICEVIAEHVSPGQVACTRRSLPNDLKPLFPTP